VLVVDDNDTNRRILKEMLESWGLPTIVFDNAAAAISHLERLQQADSALPLVITDVNMPEIDGFEFAERLRASAQLRDATVIMLTSAQRDGDQERTVKLNISAHLMKPIKQSELYDAIVAAMGPTAAERRSGVYYRNASRIDADESADDVTLKILLAEDGLANQKMAVGLLTRWGHAVTVANNGEQSVELWQRQPFDLILMDVQMPVMDGFAATRRIRTLEKGTGRRVPIIAMTAHAMKGDRERCLEAGMDEYVSKPVDRVELREAMLRCGLLTAASPTKPSSATTDAATESVPTPPIGADSAKDVSTIFDSEAALRATAGDPELLRDVIRAVMGELPTLLPRLNTALDIQDWKTSARMAHTIKGTARAVVAQQLMEVADRIEQSIAAHDADTARSLTNELDRRANELLQVLQRFLG
jgi:CheY-like chemotaxis protein